MSSLPAMELRSPALPPSSCPLCSVSLGLMKGCQPLPGCGKTVQAFIKVMLARSIMTAGRLRVHLVCIHWALLSISFAWEVTSLITAISLYAVSFKVEKLII